MKNRKIASSISDVDSTAFYVSCCHGNNFAQVHAFSSSLAFAWKMLLNIIPWLYVEDDNENKLQNSKICHVENSYLSEKYVAFRYPDNSVSTFNPVDKVK